MQPRRNVMLLSPCLTKSEPNAEHTKHGKSTEKNITTIYMQKPETKSNGTSKNELFYPLKQLFDRSMKECILPSQWK